MNEEQIKALQERLKAGLVETFDATLEDKLKEVVGPLAAAETKKIVEQMRIERSLFGIDRTGLTDKQKLDFAKVVCATGLGSSISIKDNEALIGEQDNRGGFLVSTEVAAAILRIAASVGLVMNRATKWPMSTDELDIPAYTGSALTGEFLGPDAVGSDTALTFTQKALILKTWQLSFVVGKALLQDASVELGNWLLALGGEALANMVDKQAFIGTSNPFIGLMEDTSVNVTTTGSSAFQGYKVVDDSSTLIGSVSKAARPGSIFLMSDTVWANLRVQKDDNNNYILPWAGAATNRVLAQYPSGSILEPDGEILGYAVHTSTHFPALSATAASTKYIAFGNLRTFAFGVRNGEGLEVEEHRSGSFGGKEIAKAYQRAIVYNKRVGLVNALPAAWAVAKTSA